MKIEHILPANIERRSMEIIEDELGDIILPPDEKDIIKRVVHTSADFDYVRNLRFSPGATGITSRPSRKVGVTSFSTSPSLCALRRIP